MSYFIIDPPKCPILRVSETGHLFPVRRIFCVGQNYRAHAKEMGADPDKQPPFFFSKPGDALVTKGDAMPYPPATGNLHHEIELVVAVYAEGRNIPAEKAGDYIFGYAAGLDMTRRDLQSAAKKAGRPWDMAKGFDYSAPVGEITRFPHGEIPHRGRITLKVNNQLRQEGDLSEMIDPVEEIIASLSGLVTLCPGDLIFTGTPQGVGPVEVGDVLEGEIEGIGRVMTTIVPAPEVTDL